MTVSTEHNPHPTKSHHKHTPVVVSLLAFESIDSEWFKFRLKLHAALAQESVGLKKSSGLLERWPIKSNQSLESRLTWLLMSEDRWSQNNPSYFVFKIQVISLSFMEMHERDLCQENELKFFA